MMNVDPNAPLGQQMSHSMCYTTSIMTIEKRISDAAMLKWMGADTEEEQTAAHEWANNQLRLVVQWNRTGVKPVELELPNAG